MDKPERSGETGKGWRLEAPLLLAYNNKLSIGATALLGDPEVTAKLYCNFAYLYCEGCQYPVPSTSVPQISANIYCKLRNIPNTDVHNYSTDLR